MNFFIHVAAMLALRTLPLVQAGLGRASQPDRDVTSDKVKHSVVASKDFNNTIAEASYGSDRRETYVSDATDRLFSQLCERSDRGTAATHSSADRDGPENSTTARHAAVKLQPMTITPEDLHSQLQLHSQLTKAPEDFLAETMTITPEDLHSQLQLHSQLTKAPEDFLAETMGSAKHSAVVDMEELTAFYDDSHTGFIQGSRDASSEAQHNGTNLTLWSNDLHIGPIEDLKNVFAKLRPQIAVRWLDHSFSVYCMFSHSCASDPKVTSVLSFDKLLAGDDIYVSEFYNAYRSDPVMTNVDAFVCSHSPSVCRFFLPFAKPIIAHFAVPFTYSMDNSSLLPKWLADLRKMVTSGTPGRTFVAVNNGFLKKLAPVELGVSLPMVPNLCRYIGVNYLPPQQMQPKTVFIMNMRKNEPMSPCSPDELNAVARAKGFSVSFQDQAPSGDGYWKHVATKFSAVLFCPYTTSQMAFYEAYNANIPMALPSLQLSLDHEQTGDTIWLSWHKIANAPASTDAHVSYHPDLTSAGEGATRSWLLSTDYYSGTYPNLLYFDSASHLVEIMHGMNANDFASVSRQMASRTTSLQQEALSFWGGVLRDVSLAAH